MEEPSQFSMGQTAQYDKLFPHGETTYRVIRLSEDPTLTIVILGVWHGGWESCCVDSNSSKRAGPDNIKTIGMFSGHVSLQVWSENVLEVGLFMSHYSFILGLKNMNSKFRVSLGDCPCAV